jgi:hypothetical protein
MHRCPARYVSPYQRGRRAFPRHDKRQGPAHDLAGDNNDLALAGLFLGEAPVSAIGFAVLWLDLAAEVSAVISTSPVSSG